MLNIVLHEPEMPANTGNIGRTCVATGVRLHLIEPLGFLLNDKMVKRAGLDYWDRLDVTRYDDYNDFLAKNPGAKVYMATTKSNKETCVRIPMMPGERSLNLSNSVGIVLYEALRQLDFPGLETEGQLHHYQW